ncbi:MAG: hypothetical protein JWP69_1230 [Flaviaesturariibacter sp.]|nr:hypothetical protein [Flaviaesturariibacter sp.]
MQSTAISPEQYMSELPADRKAAMNQLRTTMIKNLPPGFEEGMSYGILTYVVPHSLYPPGYHCNPKQALPFLSVASQKNFIAIYHMGLYASPELLQWFEESYENLNIGKLDMGKSCIRFKKPDRIPFDLIGELASKMTPEKWIAVYESAFKK